MSDNRVADRRALALLRERATQADVERAARTMRHCQLAEHGFPAPSGDFTPTPRITRRARRT
ncbi:hypothetical protein ACQP1V_40915 [Microtetraspora malaysiensis]|uniref:hypothetical protein n=1 Tax=Microtetraspora malaysiensis TaxID=161358 RepID=UPI003D8BE81E